MFQFQIKRAGYLSTVNRWYLDGTMVCGDIETPCCGKCDVDGSSIMIRVNSVALVGGEIDAETVTLVIDEPLVSLEKLEGQCMYSE